MSAEAYQLALGDLETSLCPHTVLVKGQDQQCTIVQLDAGSGEEPHTSTHDHDRPMSRSRRRGLIKGMAQARDRDAQRRSTTPAWMYARALHMPGSSPGCPGRRPAHLLLSLNALRIVAYQRPPCAFT
jgi:hypothetical protein